jgi:hypothetical protein
MEAHANSVEDRLIDGLSFKLSPGANYVNERKSVTYHPQGSNDYAPTGTKLIRIHITGDSWLDCSTFRIMFDLNNLGATNSFLRPVGGPHTFFRRMRLLAGNQVVEDIDQYNRVHEMFSIMTASDSRVNTNAEAFGTDWDTNGKHITVLDPSIVTGIESAQGQTVLFKPLFGLLNQNKMIPLRYCPLTIELELVNDFISPIVSYQAGTANSTTEFTTTNTSLVWNITNVQAKADICTLDNSLDNSYSEHLLLGKSLPINFNTYVSQTQSLLSSATQGQQKVRLNVTRALSRLKSVFVTLDKIPEIIINTADVPLYHGRKDWNRFYSPMQSYTKGELNKYNSDAEFEFQLNLSGKMYPEYPIRSHAEAYYQLRKTLGVQSSTLHNFDIKAQEYRNWKCILGIDFERILEAGFTGINTRAGDLLSIKFDHKSAAIADYATSMHIVLHADCILEIRDSGVQVFD